MIKSLIDAIYEHRNVVSTCVMTLENRADAAAQLGMHDLADTLYTISSKLENSSKEVQTAHAVELNQRVRDSDGYRYLTEQMADAKHPTDRSALNKADFDVTLEMVRAGVDLFLAFDPEEDEPETLIAEVLFTARDMNRRL